MYSQFLRYLPLDAYILHCGSGHDTLAFKQKGYQLDVIDYSVGMVETSTILSGLPIRWNHFYNICDENKYDAIWVDTSLLPCERNRLTEVINNIFKALKSNGICYMSFKYGSTDRYPDSRDLIDLNEQQAGNLLNSNDQILLLQQWLTTDKRAEREEEWLNIIWKKNNSFQYYPKRVFSRKEILEQKIVPRSNGVYFWWFKNIPKEVPTQDCIKFQDYYLLYVGISPEKKVKLNSKANLWTRIKAHLCGNAEGSTLRRTLGVLLEQESGFPLRRVGANHSMTFTHVGEQWLDDWLDNNACISWVEDGEPWILEQDLLSQISLPLNIKNNQHRFKKKLTVLRKNAISNAKNLDIACESGTKRSIRSNS